MKATFNPNNEINLLELIYSFFIFVGKLPIKNDDFEAKIKNNSILQMKRLLDAKSSLSGQKKRVSGKWEGCHFN